MILCIPKIADWGELMIGVDNIEPNTPPLVMVKVPPVISSMVNLLSRALAARPATAFSISARLMPSALRITGTTSPFGADTAIDISAKLLYTISSPSMRAPTAGHSFRASQTALVKNDIKPRPTPCFSLNLSLYLALISMIGDMSTSLKVVSMAVSFFTATNLRATVLRKGDIFSRRSRPESCALATGSCGLAVAATAGTGCDPAFERPP